MPLWNYCVTSSQEFHYYEPFQPPACHVRSLLGKCAPYNPPSSKMQSVYHVTSRADNQTEIKSVMTDSRCRVRDGHAKKLVSRSRNDKYLYKCWHKKTSLVPTPTYSKPMSTSTGEQDLCMWYVVEHFGSHIHITSHHTNNTIHKNIQMRMVAKGCSGIQCVIKLMSIEDRDPKPGGCCMETTD